MNSGDKFVWYVCLFCTGWVFGTWFVPEPGFSACVEVPSKTTYRYPKTKKEMRDFADAYHQQDKGWVK